MIKVVTGSHGAGVYLCETLKQFLDLQELISSLDSKNSMIIQEYVEESAGRDLRLISRGWQGDRSHGEVQHGRQLQGEHLQGR